MPFDFFRGCPDEFSSSLPFTAYLQIGIECTLALSWCSINLKWFTSNGSQENPKCSSSFQHWLERVNSLWHRSEVRGPRVPSYGSNQNWKLFFLLLVLFLFPVIYNQFISPGRAVLDNDWMELKESTVYCGNLKLEFKIIKYQNKTEKAPSSPHWKQRRRKRVGGLKWLREKPNIWQ